MTFKVIVLIQMRGKEDIQDVDTWQKQHFEMIINNRITYRNMQHFSFHFIFPFLSNLSIPQTHTLVVRLKKERKRRPVSNERLLVLLIFSNEKKNKITVWSNFLDWST